MDGINIKEFTSIDQIYELVDTNAFELKKSWQLTNIWVKYREQTLIESEKQKAQWEIDCLLFEVIGENIFPSIFTVDSKTLNTLGYPNLSNLQKDQIEYVIWRANSCNNVSLKAHYYHLLWKLPDSIKKEEYARKAISNYIASLSVLTQLFSRSKERKFEFQIGRTFETLVSIGSQIKACKKEILEASRKITFSKELSFHIKHEVVKDMLNQNKIFKPLHFTNIIELYEAHVSSDVKDLFNSVKYYIPTAIKVANKTGGDKKVWFNMKGRYYLELAEKETSEERNWIKQDFYASAIEAFKNARNSDDRLKVETLYSELRPKIKLDTVEIPYTKEVQEKFKELQEELIQKSNTILNHGARYTYSYISKTTFFPSHNYISNNYKNSRETFWDFVTTVTFDENKNISKRRNESELEKMLGYYKYHIDFTALPYLHHIIIGGIQTGILTVDNFIKYLIDESWIGKPHIRYDIGGKPENINWVRELSPALIDFFIQVSAWGKSKYYTPNFMLSIDSLTLKIEGLFRNFCERAGMPISTSNSKGMQESNLNYLINSEGIIEHFNEDDLLLFKFLFSNDGGINIRNKIAHCFLTSENYSSDIMLLLISVILRLGKYNQSKVANSPKENP